MYLLREIGHRAYLYQREEDRWIQLACREDKNWRRPESSYVWGDTVGELQRLLEGELKYLDSPYGHFRVLDHEEVAMINYIQKGGSVN